MVQLPWEYSESEAEHDPADEVRYLVDKGVPGALRKLEALTKPKRAFAEKLLNVLDEDDDELTKRIDELDDEEAEIPETTAQRVAQVVLRLIAALKQAAAQERCLLVFYRETPA